MDYLGKDDLLTSEYDGMSLDAILAEFRGLPADGSAAEAPEGPSADRNSAQAKKSRGEHLSMPSTHRKKRDKQRGRSPKEKRAAPESFAYSEEEILTQPARGRDSVLSESVESLPLSAPAEEESVAPPAAEAQTEAVSAAPRRESAHPGAYTAAPPRRSARPSDDEVREFLDAFKRGDFLDLTEQEVSEPPIAPDARFYMGGAQTSTIRYDGKEVDMSADASYRAPLSQDEIYSYARESDGEDEEEDKRPTSRLGALGSKVSEVLRPPRRSAPGRHSAKPAESGGAKARDRVSYEETEPAAGYVDGPDELSFESSFTDLKDSDYAVHREFETAPPPDYDELYDEVANPGSFREFLFSRLTALLYRLRRGGRYGARTMEEDDEDLGHELSCAKASKYYGSHIRSMRLRLRISAVLLLVMLWVSVGLPVPGMIRTDAVANALCLGLQLGIMLLCLDVLTTGVMNAARGKFGADSMAVLACLVTSIDAILTAKLDVGTPHLALCLISSLSLCGEMFAAVLHARAMRKALRVPAIGRRCFAVTGETDGTTGDVTILKSVRPALGFVRRSEQSSPDEDLFRKLSLPLLILALLLSIVIAFVKKDFPDLLYIFSVVLCPAVPFAAMCCYSLPFFLGSMRIFSSGAAIAGWSGMSDIGVSRNLIVTDRDLFPDGTVEIGTIRVFADEDPGRIISYAGSMMAAAGSCSALAFGELMERNGCRTRNIENFEYLAGGGMKGVIDGRVILCGSTDLMRLMNVRIPFRLVDRTSVLLAADGILCGIFNMKYTAKPQVREALVDLMRSNRHPVFAIRDFNVTPEMLHVAFEVATDGYDFPPYVDRFDMSSAEPSEDSQIAAIICREGLGPLVHTADTARSIYSATRINTLITAFSALLGVFVAALRLLGAGSVSIGFLLVFMLLFALSTAAVSFFTRL